MIVKAIEALKHSDRVFAMALLLVIALVTAPMFWSPIAQAQNTRVVTIFADGEEIAFPTDAKTVEEALGRAAVAYSANDLIEPSPDTAITEDAFNINVYRARPILVVDGDGTRKVILSPYQSPRLIAEHAGFDVRAEDNFQLDLIDEIITEGTLGLKLTIIRANPVTLDLYGTKSRVYTHTTTVEELLAEHGITPEVTDVVRPKPAQSLEPGGLVSVIRVGNDRTVAEESIPFGRRIIQDTSQPIGYEKITQAGKPGVKLVTYKLTFENGLEVKREAVNTTIISQPVEEIAIVGADYTGTYPDNGSILAALRMCETHGNYQADTGNGYYGAYQFLDSTWDNLGTGYARADLAPASVQDQAVITLANRAGGGFWSQFPGCSSSLDLPQFPY